MFGSLSVAMATNGMGIWFPNFLLYSLELSLAMLALVACPNCVPNFSLCDYQYVYVNFHRTKLIFMFKLIWQILQKEVYICFELQVDYLSSWHTLLQPIIRKDIELHVVEVPSAIKLERPFSVIWFFGMFYMSLITTSWLSIF